MSGPRDVRSTKAMLQNRDASQPAVETIVRISVNVVFHRDMLGPQLLVRGASREVDRTDAKAQMSLDLDDMW